MPDHRVHCPHPTPAVDQISLSGSESHHLVTVNRARVGDPVIAFDGAGIEWNTRLVKADRRTAVLQIESRQEARRPPCLITLAQSIPKGGGVMESIVRHATEIGVHRIVPIHSERTQVHWEGARESKKVDKWHATALEAAKQCGNPWLPEITAPRPFADSAAELIAAQDASLVASLHPGARPLLEVVSGWTASATPPRRVLWWVGPEGDFTAAEIDRLVELHSHPVSLGQLVLRCDTAATYALAVISAALNP